jgi:hypothetical protein
MMEGGSTLTNDNQMELETDKIETIEGPTGLSVMEPEQVAILPPTAAVAEFAAAITRAVGAGLHTKITTEISEALKYEQIADGESYKKAAEKRKLLKGLVNKEGDPGDPSRMVVRVTFAIMDDQQNKIALATETTIGTLSLEDLYGPLAGILGKLHKATTQGKNEAMTRIEEVRGILESSMLTYDDQQRELQRQAERKQQLINEQSARTDRAKHWIAQLFGHGVDMDAINGVLTDTLTATDRQVDSLEELLKEVMVEEQRKKDEADRLEAIKTAKEMGLSSVVAELEAEAQENAPVVIQAPAPPPPPSFRPVSSAVAQLATPDVKGLGRSKTYTIRIDNPNAIPAEFLLPPPNKLYDPSAYPRLRAEAKLKGMMMNVPGVTVIEDSKLTQR